MPMTKKVSPPKGACPRRRKRSCSTLKPGSAMAAWSIRPLSCAPRWEEGVIEAFIRREVLPYTPDAWVKADATKVGFEVSVTRHFYKPQPLRTLDDIRADILAIEQEAGGLLDEFLEGGAQ